MIQDNNILNDCLRHLGYATKFIEDIGKDINEFDFDSIEQRAEKAFHDRDTDGFIKSLKDLMMLLEGKGIYRPDAPVRLIRGLVNGINLYNEDIFQVISRSGLSMEEKMKEMEFLASCAAITQLGYVLLKCIVPEVKAASSGEHVFLVIDGFSPYSNIFVDFSIDSIKEINMNIYDRDENNLRLKKDLDFSAMDKETVECLTEYYSFFRIVSGIGLNHNIHNNLGLAYDKLGMPEKATQELNEALRLDPGYVEVHNNLAITFHKMGMISEAENELKAAIRQNPLYLEARCNLGKIYAASGRFEEALCELQEALAINPDSARAHNNIGEIYYIQEKKTDAMNEFFEALRKDPDFLAAHTNIGTLFMESGRYEEAKKEFQKVLDIDPGLTEAHYGIGLSHYELKNYEKASQAFIRAVYNSPELMENIPDKLILKVRQGVSRLT